jgi:hypothetical protein
MSSYEYNQLLKFLYFEGYADSYAEAEELLESMSDEKFEDLFESSGMSPENRRTWNRLVRQYGERPFTNPKQSITRSARKPDPIPTTPKPKPRRKKSKFIDKSGASDQGNTRDSRRRFGEEKENFDDVVEYLFVEGFTDTIEGAEVMAENISDNWIHLILSEAPFQIYGPDPHGPSDSELRPIGKPYNNKKRAKTRADKLDQEIGGYRHSVKYVDEKYVKALDTTGKGADRRAHTTDPTVRPIRKKPTPEKYKHSEAEFDSTLTSPSTRKRKDQRRKGTGGFNA